MADFTFGLEELEKTIDQSQFSKGNYSTDNIYFPGNTEEPETVTRILNITNNNSEYSGTSKIELGTGYGVNGWKGGVVINLGENTNVSFLDVMPRSGTEASIEFKLEEGATLQLQMRALSNNDKHIKELTIDMGSVAGTKLILDEMNGGYGNTGYTLTGLVEGTQIVPGFGSGRKFGKVVFEPYEEGGLSGTLRITTELWSGGAERTEFGFEVLDLPEGFKPEDAFEYDPDTGIITYACFLKGTKIATPEGEVKVEDLKAGDQVLTASGDVATVKWLGFRKLYRNRIPAADAVRAFPILIKKDAIADNVPHADLTVSPGHHLYFDGLLIPAMMLVNGQTITQQFNTPSFEYYHVELEEFDILLAENVPAESYVDTGNRSMFQNAKEVDLNPDFGPAEGRPEVEGITVVREGALVEAVRKQLLARAEQMTGARRTQDAELRIEVDGQVIEGTPEFVKEGVYSFELPANAGDIRILSRSATVRDVTPLARRDIRQIGVGLSAIAIVDEQGRRELDLNAESLTGLNAAQDVRGTLMRWTTGDAVVPASEHQASAKATLELTVLRTYTYWVDSVSQNATKVA